MDIKLTWTNPNSVYDEIKVFRSEVPIDPQNLPEPIATLTQVGVNEFIDTGLVQGKKYYYALRIAYGEDYSVSEPIATQAMHYTGPLQQELLVGDMDLGYFGFADHGDFLSREQVREVFDFVTEGTWSSFYHWHKLAYKGKVLLIPNSHMKTRISWNHLYENGLVYGDDVPSWDTGGVEQGHRVTVGQDVFIVRLFKGFDSGVIPSFSTNATGTSTNRYFTDTTLENPQGEYFDIMRAFSYLDTTSEFDPNYLTDLTASFSHGRSNNYYSWLQDDYLAQESVNGVIFGGCVHNSAGKADRVPFRGWVGISRGKAASGAVSLNNLSTYSCWWPVFELEA